MPRHAEDSRRPHVPRPQAPRLLGALRTLYGNKSYARSYRSAQAAAEADLPRKVRVRIEAHQLLRQHGQETCKRTHPLCELCPLRPDCAYYRIIPARA